MTCPSCSSPMLTVEQPCELGRASWYVSRCVNRRCGRMVEVGRVRR